MAAANPTRGPLPPTNRAFLEFVASILPSGDDPYRAALIEQAANLLAERDSVILHDVLERDNDPQLLHQFLAEAARHGLQYLGDAHFSHMVGIGIDSAGLDGDPARRRRRSTFSSVSIFCTAERCGQRCCAAKKSPCGIIWCRRRCAICGSLRRAVGFAGWKQIGRGPSRSDQYRRRLALDIPDRRMHDDDRQPRRQGGDAGIMRRPSEAAAIRGFRRPGAAPARRARRCAACRSTCPNGDSLVRDTAGRTIRVRSADGRRSRCSADRQRGGPISSCQWLERCRPVAERGRIAGRRGRRQRCSPCHQPIAPAHLSRRRIGRPSAHAARRPSRSDRRLSNRWRRRCCAARRRCTSTASGSPMRRRFARYCPTA